MANGISLEIAKKHLDAWLTAELEVTTHQSYTIGSRSLTKANLSEIRHIGEIRLRGWRTSKSAAEETVFSAPFRGTCKKGR